MLYRVQIIDGPFWCNTGDVETAIISEWNIESVRRSDCDVPGYKQDACVLIHCRKGPSFHAVGTIDTFATPWEPDAGERRFKDALRDWPKKIPEPDDKDADAACLRHLASDFFGKDGFGARRLESMAKRLEGVSNVPEPPVSTKETT